MKYGLLYELCAHHIIVDIIRLVKVQHFIHTIRLKLHW